MIAWLADILSHLAGRYGDHGDAMAAMSWAIGHFCFVVDVCKDWQLSVPIARDLYDRGHEFLSIYKLLATSAVQDRRKAFAWKPKFHYFEHMLDRLLVERIHPRVWWNFKEEDLIGLGIDIASRTHKMNATERVLDR